MAVRYRVFVYASDPVSGKKTRVVRKDLALDSPTDVFAWLFHSFSRGSPEMLARIVEVKVVVREGASGEVAWKAA